MLTTAFVNIWGKRVGAIAWDAGTGLGSFEYDPGFLRANWDLAPLKMPVQTASGRIFAFPDHQRSNTFKGLPGLLADALPDKYGNALINAWLAKQGRPTDSLNPVETLCFIGQRGMGALEFEPVQPASSNTATKIELGNLIEIADQILQGRQDFSASLSPADEKALLDILKIGTSAGGARAKALIGFNPETGEVRSGQADLPPGFTHWLIKFDGVDDAQFGASTGYGRVEMAYYRMAVDAGIAMMESRLYEEHGRAHFMTRRFDRYPDHGKIHVQTFCAMQHYDFNEVNLFSYEQLFETMRALGLSYPKAEQMFRRMVFNVLAKNCDDHTKNFAFTMDQSGTWDLSPAYDICHAYRPGSPWVSQHALSVNGKRTDIGLADLLEIGRQMNIRKAEKIVREVAAVTANWMQYAKAIEVDAPLAAAIEKTLIRL
jgi:serine/threonine-protein kinase HipA